MKMDQTGRSTEQEFAISGLNRRSELLRKIQAALRRIEDGAFGIGPNCEETIARNRLVGYPLDTFVYSHCQQVVDHGEGPSEPVSTSRPGRLSGENA